MELLVASKSTSFEGRRGMRGDLAVNTIPAASEDTQTHFVGGSVLARRGEGVPDFENPQTNGSGFSREFDEQLGVSEHATVALGPAAASKQTQQRPSAVLASEKESVNLAEKDGFHPERFWAAYAADRYNWLLGEFDGGKRGTEGGGKGKNEENRVEKNGQAGGSANRRDGRPTTHRNPTKYLVFEPNSSGLGNHMSGMMSAFVLSVATERVFLHAWTSTTDQCGATYTDLFVPPFEPWSISATAGARVSASGRLLGNERDDTEDDRSREGTGTGKQHKEEHEAGHTQMAGGLRSRTPGLPPAAERRRCHLDLDMKGVASGEFDRVLINKRGQDPRPDCPILFVKSNQFFVEFVTSTAYGTSKVGGTLLSEWLQSGNAAATLFAGLFRPVQPVRQKIEDAASQLFPAVGQSMAAHARAWQLKNDQQRHSFVECLGRLGTANNISAVVLATDIPHFDKDASSTLKHKGITVVSTEGVQRTGEGTKMRNSVAKIRNAVVDMFLMGKADIAVTSPQSSFSALGAAAGGPSTRRVGGLACETVINEPEFHMLACGMRWTLDVAKWRRVYPGLVDSTHERCNSRRNRQRQRS